MALKVPLQPPVTRLSLVSSFRPSSSQPLQSSFFANGVGINNCIQISYSNKLRCCCLGGGGNIGFFGRLARLFRSYANSVLMFLRGPEWIIEQAVLAMNDDLMLMQQATDVGKFCKASENQLESKCEGAMQAAIDWHKKAQLAFEKGDKNFAREALRLRNSFLGDVNSFQGQCDQMKRVVNNLVYKSRLLESKIQEANARKEASIAITATTKTVTRVQSMVGKLYGRSAVSVFDKIEEKLLLTLEYEAESLHCLTTNNLEEKFALLEGSSSKQQLNMDLKEELPTWQTDADTEEHILV